METLWVYHTRIDRCLRVIAIPAVAGLLLALAPPAVADPADLRAEVDSARAATSCPPFQNNPLIDQVAQQVLDSTNGYVDHASHSQPIQDALPLLKDNGYEASKAVVLAGASTSEADAIRSVKLEGFRSIPDCTFTDAGYSTLQNADTDMVLTTVVLTGK